MIGNTRFGTAALGALLLVLGLGLHAARAADPVNVEGARTTAGGGETAGHGAAGGGHAEHAPSLLNPINTGLVTSLTTLIVFLILLAVLGKYAWGPIAGGLKAREDKIRQDIADAEAARARAEATLKEYSARLATAEAQVREMIAKATAQGEQVAAGIRTRAQQEAEETRERTIREIDAARDSAVAQVHDHAATLATTIAEKILRRNLNPDDQRDLVAQSLNQVDGISKN